MFINETTIVNAIIHIYGHRNEAMIAEAQRREENAEKWRVAEEERIVKTTQKITDFLGEEYSQCPICDNPYSSMTEYAIFQTHYPKRQANLYCSFCKHHDTVSLPVPVKEWKVSYTLTQSGIALTPSDSPPILAESPEHAESLIRRFFGLGANDEKLQIHEIIENI